MAPPPPLFDRKLYLRRQAHAKGPLRAELLARLVADLSDRLSVINRHFGTGLLISPFGESAAAAIQSGGKVARLEARAPVASDDLSLTDGGLDLAISLMDLHAVNDVPGYLAQVAAALKPDGLAIFAFFAGDTLRELRNALLTAEQEMTGGASPRVAPMIGLNEAGALLQRAGLALPVCDLERIPLRYGEALTLMRDIKELGFSNTMRDRRKGLTSPALLLRAARHYAEQFADRDGRLPATLEIAWAMAWKPHPSQQQPLKPGSAKTRLADALKPGGPAASAR